MQKNTLTTRTVLPIHEKQLLSEPTPFVHALAFKLTKVSITGHDFNCSRRTDRANTNTMQATYRLLWSL